MSSDRSRPSPRSISGPNSSSIRPVPVPRSSSERNGLSASAVADRGLDRLVGDVQLADAVPLGGVLAEIGLRGGGARRPHRGEPLAVARDHRVGRVEPLQQRARDGRAAALLGQPEERPGALAEALDQAGLGEQLQVPRDARLRLAQDVGEVGDGQLGLGQQRQHAQARLLAGGLERRIERVETEPIACCRHPVLSTWQPTWGRIPLHKDIFIR